MHGKLFVIVVVLVISVTSKELHVENIIDITGVVVGEKMIFRVKDLNYNQPPQGTNGAIIFATNDKGEEVAIKMAKNSYESHLQLANEFKAFVHLYKELEMRGIQTNVLPKVFCGGEAIFDNAIVPVIVMEKFDKNLAQYAKLVEEMAPNNYITEEDTVNFSVQIVC